MSGTYTVVKPEPLRRTWVAVFQALGLPREDADLLVDVHIDSELRGEESHGVHLLIVHAEKIKAGAIRPKPKVTVLMDRRAVALFDAHHSVGQVVAARAMRLAVSKARSFGTGIVGIRNAHSYTSAKYYPLMAAAEGMIGITYTNSRPMMPPHGGASSIVGNNPMSIAAPAGKEPPFVLDMACATAKEKIWQAADEGRPIPDSWALGRDGRPTTDPKEALASGVLLPFGGYKAFGMAVAHEVLTGILFGGDIFTGDATGFRPYETLMRVSQYFQAINIEWFMPLEEFRTRMDVMIRAIKGSKLRPGVERVYLPGERGFLEMELRRHRGIPIHERAFAEMQKLARELNVAPVEV
ncbi:MAG: Ldh family oxidoreductase [Proteobacteria bacterium]|nr:Ldh family oxidoreductase [Pseudomonadota bacterium]